MKWMQLHADGKRQQEALSTTQLLYFQCDGQLVRCSYTSFSLSKWRKEREPETHRYKDHGYSSFTRKWTACIEDWSDVGEGPVA